MANSSARLGAIGNAEEKEAYVIFQPIPVEGTIQLTLQDLDDDGAAGGLGDDVHAAPEQLGVRLDVPPTKILEVLHACGITFARPIEFMRRQHHFARFVLEHGGVRELTEASLIRIFPIRRNFNPLGRARAAWLRREAREVAQPLHRERQLHLVDRRKRGRCVERQPKDRLAGSPHDPPDAARLRGCLPNGH